MGRGADRPRAQPGRAAPAARGRGGPGRPARVRRPDGGRLLRGGDGRGGDRRRRRGAARAVPGAHRRRGVRRRRPRPRARPAAARPGSAPLAGHRGGLRGLGRLPRLRRAGRPGAARARLLHPRRRAVGGAPPAVRGPRRQAARQPRRRRGAGAGGRGAHPRLRDPPGRGVLHRRAAARRRAHHEPLRRRRAGRAHAGLRPERLRGRPRGDVGDRQRGQPRLLPRAGRHPRRHPGRDAEGLPPLARGQALRLGALTGVRARVVRLLRAQARRPEGDAAALEARAQRRLRGHRRAGGAALRRRGVLGPGQEALRGDGRPPAARRWGARSGPPSG